MCFVCIIKLLACLRQNTVFVTVCVIAEERKRTIWDFFSISHKFSKQIIKTACAQYFSLIYKIKNADLQMTTTWEWCWLTCWQNAISRSQQSCVSIPSGLLLLAPPWVSCSLLCQPPFQPEHTKQTNLYICTIRVVNRSMKHHHYTQMVAFLRKRTKRDHIPHWRHTCWGYLFFLSSGKIFTSLVWS